MDFWNEQAEQLEVALSQGIDQPLLDFLQKASHQDIVKLAGDDFSKISEKAQQSIVFVLIDRLKSKLK